MTSYLLRFSAKCGTVSSKTILQSCGRTLQTIIARKWSSEGSKVAVNGIQLHCDQTGKGNHSVLLLPGALGSGKADMGPQFNGLDKEKYKLVTYDPRGCGKSRPPERDFPLDFYRRDAKDAADLMAVLGHDRYSVLGWSDGGMVGIIMAAMYPDHVQKLAVWGANAYVTEKDIQAFEATRDVSKWSERMRAPMVEMYGQEHFQTLWSAWIDGVHNIMVENRTDVCMGDCRLITCPTLIVHGEKDAMVPIEHPHYLNQNIRGSRFLLMGITVRGAGLHCVVMTLVGGWPLLMDFAFGFAINIGQPPTRSLPHGKDWLLALLFPKVLMMAEGKHNLHMRYAEEFNKHVETFLDSSNAS